MEHHPLRRFRLELDLSQDDLAERTGESKSKISRIENGHQEADLDFIRKVAALSEDSGRAEVLLRDLIASPVSPERAESIRQGVG